MTNRRTQADGGIAMPSLQGWKVVKVLPDAVYVRIPKDLQRPTNGCACTYCVAHPDEEPMWDTLGVPTTLGPKAIRHVWRDQLTWTLHAPEWR